MSDPELSIEQRFRTEVFTASDGDPAIRWLTDEQVIARMAARVQELEAELAAIPAPHVGIMYTTRGWEVCREWSGHIVLGTFSDYIQAVELKESLDPVLALMSDNKEET